MVYLGGNPIKIQRLNPFSNEQCYGFYLYAFRFANTAESRFLNEQVDRYTTFVRKLSVETHPRSELGFHLSPSFSLFLVLDPGECVGNIVNRAAFQAESSALIGAEPRNLRSTRHQEEIQ